jgi:hypothetical protein
MNGREFLNSSAALAASQTLPAWPQAKETGFPASVLNDDPYIETTSIAEYRNAPASSHEAAPRLD